MNHPLTIAYMTSRRDCRIEWFLDSLQNQMKPTDSIRVVVVDFWNDERPEGWLSEYPSESLIRTAPKPNVWQGKYKLTKEDWFAASNARNTALCLATDGWIAYVDDLSVLMPHWLQSVREAMNGTKIVLGAYKKVKHLKVEKGIAVSYEEFANGIDSRWPKGRDDKPVTAAGSWLYGCSLAGPVEAFLKVGGWPEALCDSLGSEDYIEGIMLEKAGYEFLYDRRMLTLESDELHWQLPIMVRTDKGVSPNDKSHAVLKMAMGGMKFHPNHFGDEGIRGLRQRILRGEPFPFYGIPQHDYYDGQPLSEMVFIK